MRKTTFLATMVLVMSFTLNHTGVGAAPQLTIPADPSNLVATAISTSAITINWTDNSDNEAGFKIEMCQGSGCTDFVQAGSVTAGGTNATASNLAKNKTYTFRVVAYNAAGDSGYSNTAEATTLIR